MRVVYDQDGAPLPIVTVKLGHWVTKPIGPSTTAQVTAAELGLASFVVGQKLAVESIGTLLVKVAPSGWSENWTNNRDTNPLGRAIGNTVLTVQEKGDTLYLRDEGVTERGEPTSVTVSCLQETRL